MARFTNGYIKAHRKLTTEKWRKQLDGYGKAILFELMMMANWLDEGEFKTGQVVTSERELAEILGFSRKIIRARLDSLERYHTLSRQKAHDGTIITLCKFAEYQGLDEFEGPTKRPTLGPTADTTSGPINKELKKERKISPPSADAFGEELASLSREWLKFALEVLPSGKRYATWTDGHFAAGLSKVKKKLSITTSEVRAMFEFIRSDSFWRKNALSPEGLLEKSKNNGYLKADNILLAMKGRAPVSNSAEQIQVTVRTEI